MCGQVAPSSLSELDSHQKTAAHYAAEEGRLECLMLLYELAPSSVEAVDEGNATPAHWAAAAGHLEIVRCLIMNDI